MYKSKMIVDLPEIADLPDLFEACLMGKQHRQSFPKEASKAKASLELVHMDLCEKMDIEVLGGLSIS